MKAYKISAAAAALVGGLSLAMAAHASVIPAGSIGGAPNSAAINYENFDEGGSLANLPNGLHVAFSGPGAGTVAGSSSDAAAPYLSGSNGNGFDNAGTTGPDTTNYLTTGTGQVTLTFDTAQAYLGVLWGSVDDYNTIEFFDGGSMVASFTGDDILSGANGDQGVNGTLYVNFGTDGGTTFDQVVFLSSKNAFEFDNVAFGEQNPTVPSPEPITLSLFGAGLAGLGFARRRKA